MATKNGSLSHFPPHLKAERASESERVRRTLRRRIERFELRYEMSTAEMLDRTETGEMRETAEISRWQYDADELADLTGHAAKSTAGSGSTATN